MKRRIMAICDSDERYAERLADYASRRGSVPFEVHAFSGAEALKKFPERERIGLLLISEDCLSDEMQVWGIPAVVCLSEDSRRKEDKDLKRIYKYRSAAEILREAIAFCREDSFMKSAGNPGLKLILIYSPLGRCGKTSLFLALGQILSERRPVLGISLETFGSLAACLKAPEEAARSLLDLIFCLRQADGTQGACLAGAVRNAGDFDILLPSSSGQELYEMTEGDLERLLAFLSEESRYEALVIDAGSGDGNLRFWIENADLLLMPGLTDAFSAGKLRSFEAYLSEMGEGVHRKMRKLHLPLPETLPPGSFGELPFTPLGSYVRELLKRDGF
ncbi:MAG: hypothetical protein K6E30_05595 [Lachnospiraceae bacterium]|nr:hypothetical protein [Lachnospiraceae bacterium]